MILFISSNPTADYSIMKIIVSCSPKLRSSQPHYTHIYSTVYSIQWVRVNQMSNMTVIAIDLVLAGIKAISNVCFFIQFSAQSGEQKASRCVISSFKPLTQ